MSEAKHLAEAVEGFLTHAENGWFAPITAAVEGLTPEQAAKVPAAGFNSIWAVVNHLSFWQEVVLLRLRGQEVNQQTLGGKKDWAPIPEPVEMEPWQAACQKMLAINQELAREAASLGEEQLDEPASPGKAKRWHLIQGSIAHNAYHTCEVISIRHMLGLWLEEV